MSTIILFLSIFVLAVTNTVAQVEAPLKATTFIEGMGGHIRGKVILTQNRPGDPVYFRVYVEGFEPGPHGFHIHESGDVSDSCQNTGPHFNPDNHIHAGPTDDIRHIGDLGNLEADAAGVIDTALIDYVATLYGPRSVIGRSIIIHAGPDDLGRGGHPLSRLNGNAGMRAACGVIGIKVEDIN